jgi:hypothetical protein
MLMRSCYEKALAALTLMMISMGLAFAGDAGTVLTFKGDCFVEAGGSKILLKTGDVVHVGDTLDIPDGSKLKLRMIDGSVISAASGTTMTITAFSGDDKGGKRDADISLAAGLLRAVVTPASAPSRFEVETATGVAAVRSTDWFVEAQAGTTRVGVLKGKVNLSSRATHHDVDIPARWGARLEAGKDPVPPRIWQDSEFDSVIARTDIN